MAKSRSLTLASDVKYRDSRVIDDRGEINASSKKDLLEILGSLTSDDVKSLTDTEATKEEARQKRIEEATVRREAVNSAFSDVSGESHREIGQEMAGVINESVTRQGILRSVAQYQTLSQGERPETYVQEKSVEVVTTSGATSVTTQIVRDNIVNAPEVDIQARPYIEKRKIDRSREDILQRKFNEAEEQILVGEDRLFIKAVDQLATRYSRESEHVGTQISPTILASGIDLITGHNVPLAKLLFSSNLWAKIITNRDFENLIDPVSRLELLRTGFVGALYGAEIMTDHYREPTQKVIEPNELYYFSDEQFIGEYTDRGGVESTPVGVDTTGIAGLGWHLVESLSIALTNFRGIAKTTLTS